MYQTSHATKPSLHSAYDIAEDKGNTRQLRDIELFQMKEESESQLILMDAVRNQSLETVEKLCKNESLSRDEMSEIRLNNQAQKYSVLYIAVQVGNKAIIEALLRAEFKAECAHSHSSLLIAAADSGHDHLLEFLKNECNQDINFTASWNRLGKTPLERAAVWGHMSTVKALIELGAKVTPALYPCAAAGGNVELLQYLDKEYCNLTNCNSKAFDDINPLLCACIGGSIQTVKYLTKEKKMNPNLQTTEDLVTCSALEIAAFNGFFKLCKFLSTKPVAADLTDSILPCAAINGHTKIILYFLTTHQSEMNVNATDRFGLNALHRASQHGHLSTVTALLENMGAQPLAVTNEGNTAIHLAAREGHTDIIQCITSHMWKKKLPIQTTIDARNSDGLTALHLACIRRNLTAVEALLAHHASLKMQSNTGETCLHYAVQGGDPEIVKLLLKSEPSVIHKKDYYTEYSSVYLVRKREGKKCTWKYVHVERKFVPQFLRANGNNLKHAKTLLEGYGQDPSPDFTIRLRQIREKMRTQDPDRTPLHTAVATRHPCIDIIRKLLEHDADVNEMDKSRFTPIDIAATFGNAAVVQLLKQHKAEISSKTIECALDNSTDDCNQAVIAYLLEEQVQSTTLVSRGYLYNYCLSTFQ